MFSSVSSSYSLFLPDAVGREPLDRPSHIPPGILEYAPYRGFARPLFLPVVGPYFTCLPCGGSPARDYPLLYGDGSGDQPTANKTR